MSIVIVPNVLRDAINAKLDTALTQCPEAAIERGLFYNELLAYFYKHGEIPDFTIEPNPPTDLDL